MKRWAFALLATTSLTVASQAARAAVVYDSVAGFGAYYAARTAVAQGDTLFVGDLGTGGVRYFEVPVLSVDQTVRLQFTGARQSSTGVAADFLSGSVLPTFLGTPVVQQFAGPSVNVTAGTSEGTSFAAGYAPSLTLYTRMTVPGASSSTSEGGSLVVLAQIVPPAFSNFVPGGSSSTSEGGSFSLVSNSYAVDLLLPAGSALPLAFSYDFDWTLEVTTTALLAEAVPEPGSAVLLGLGALAAARMRRRNRVV